MPPKTRRAVAGKKKRPAPKIGLRRLKGNAALQAIMARAKIPYIPGAAPSPTYAVFVAPPKRKPKKKKKPSARLSNAAAVLQGLALPRSSSRLRSASAIMNGIQPATARSIENAANILEGMRSSPARTTPNRAPTPRTTPNRAPTPRSPTSRSPTPRSPTSYAGQSPFINMPTPRSYATTPGRSPSDNFINRLKNQLRSVENVGNVSRLNTMPGRMRAEMRNLTPEDAKQIALIYTNLIAAEYTPKEAREALDWMFSYNAPVGRAMSKPILSNNVHKISRNKSFQREYNENPEAMQQRLPAIIELVDSGKTIQQALNATRVRREQPGVVRKNFPI